MSEQTTSTSHNPFDLDNARRLLQPWTELTTTLTDHAAKVQERAVDQYQEVAREGFGLMNDGLQIWTKAVKRCGELSRDQVKKVNDYWSAEA